jgi:hypothetical protein
VKALTRFAALSTLSRGAGEGLAGHTFKAPLSHRGRGGTQPVRAGWVRVMTCWLACVTLLLNVLLPTALSVGIGLLHPERDIVGSSLCSAMAGRDFPGKAKPGLLVHHCTLCSVPAAPLLLRDGGVAHQVQIAETAYPVVRPALAPAPFWHGPAQARAPPVAS